jgi:hypothetical protein
MNLVGKIFTVLILIMSLAFMMLAVTVFATHKNWREIVTNTEARPGMELGLKKQLDNANEEKARLTDQKTKLQADADAEKKALRDSLAKAEQESDDLKRQRDDAAKKVVDLEKRAREAVAAMQATQETLAKMREEIGTLRKDIGDARKSRDDYFKEVVRLTDELHQAVVQQKLLKERTAKLSEQLVQARDILRKHDLRENDDPNTPPVSDGLVRSVQGETVEITLGSDDGVRVGHKFDIFGRRGGANTYLGRVEAVAVKAESAACQIDRKLLKGPIQNGDTVVSTTSKPRPKT